MINGCIKSAADKALATDPARGNWLAVIAEKGKIHNLCAISKNLRISMHFCVELRTKNFKNDFLNKKIN